MRKWLLLIMLLFSSVAFSQVLTIEGYGVNTTGGVTPCHVSNASQLTSCLASSGKHIIFDAGGNYNGAFTVPANTFIDGFSAPAVVNFTNTAGSCLLVHSSNVMIQGVRIRDCGDKAIETFGVSGLLSNFVVDHVEMEGGDDEIIAITTVSEYTLSWSILANNTNSGCVLLKYSSFHISIHHNLMYGCNANDSRVPLIWAGGDGDPAPAKDYGIIADVVGNVSSNFLYGLTTVDDIAQNYGNLKNNYLDGQDPDHRINTIGILGNNRERWWLGGNASVLNPAGAPAQYAVQLTDTPYCVTNSNTIDSTKHGVWNGSQMVCTTFSGGIAQPTTPFSTPAITTSAITDNSARLAEWNNVIDNAGVKFKFADDSRAAAVRAGVARPTSAMLAQTWNAQTAPPPPTYKRFINHTIGGGHKTQ